MKQKSILILSICLSLFLISCLSSGPQKDKESNNPASVSEQAEHQKNKHQSKDTVPETEKKDYLDESLVLAAFMWEDGGYSETQFFPARIINKQEDQSKIIYNVEAAFASQDIAEGTQNTTTMVIVKSHPAKREELESGMIVLFVPDTRPHSHEELKNDHWKRGIVSSQDNTEAGMVKIDYVWYLNKKDEADRSYQIPVQNIRIMDKTPMQTRVTKESP